MHFIFVRFKMTEAEQSYTNGTINEEDEENKVRPADIEAVSV